MTDFLGTIAKKSCQIMATLNKHEDIKRERV